MGKGLHCALNSKGSATLLQTVLAVSSNALSMRTIWDRIFRVQKSLKSFWVFRLYEHVTNHDLLTD